MLLILILLAAAHLIGLLALSVGQHVRRCRGRLLAVLWVATCITPVLGLVGTIGGLTGAFEAVSSGPAEARAAMLSQGISEAMNCTAFGLGLFLPFLASTIVATVRTRRASPRAPLQQVERGPSELFR